MKLRAWRTIASSILVASALGGCGAADAVRPDEPTYADAVGAGAARFVPRNSSPFIVDWEPDQHAALDAAMQKGIVVVAYDGSTITLLPDCRLEGVYSASGVTLQSGTVKVRSSDSAGASAPPVGVVRDVRADLERSAALDVAYTIAAKREAGRPGARRTELQGMGSACRGATHFVHGALLGAFRRLSGASAEVHGGASVFGVGATAGSTSARATESRGGDLDTCQQPDVVAPAPAGAEASGCSVPLQLELRPIAPSTLVRLTLVSFTIEPRNSSGGGWDGENGPPDPIFEISSGLGLPRRTASFENRTTATPSVAMDVVEVAENEPLTLRVIDEDVLGSETIGEAQLTLAEIRSGPYFDKELRASGAVTARLRLQATIESLSVPAR